MQKLCNPHLESCSKDHSFLINIPATMHIDNGRMMSYYESHIQTNIKPDEIDLQKLFSCEDKEMSNENESLYTIQIGSEDEGNIKEEITIDTLISEQYPFKDPVSLYDFIASKNEYYRIIQIEAPQVNKLFFKCAAKNCPYQVECIREDDSYFIIHQTCHSCEKIECF